jgi:hypothetical protein
MVWFSLITTAIADNLPDPGVSELSDLEYMREVLMYCGISDPEAVKGFLDRKGSIMAKHEINRDEELQAGSMARQRSYAEWQNRGLGGFKGWCRKEGADYTETLKTFAVK